MISYDEYRKRATQELGSISTYDLEGDFDKVVAHLQKEHQEYKEYLEKPHELRESNYSGGAYIDGTEKKAVIFDRIYIDCVETYDNGREFRVKGERNLTAEELAALAVKEQARNSKRADEEREQLRKLREKYPNG